MDIVRTDQEISDLEDEAYRIMDDQTSKFWGMTYEDGIVEVLGWLRGDNLEDII